MPQIKVGDMIATEAKTTKSSCLVSGEIEVTELRTAFSVFARELIKVGFLLRKWRRRSTYSSLRLRLYQQKFLNYRAGLVL